MRKKSPEEMRDNIIATCVNNGERQYIQRYLLFTGLTESQFLRQGAIEKLVRENAMPSPLQKYVEKTNAQAGK